METQIVHNSGEDLFELLAQKDDDKSTRGIIIFATHDCLSKSDELDSLLKEISTPVFGGIFPEVIYEGQRYSDAIVVGSMSIEPTVTVVPELSDPQTEFGKYLPETAPENGTAFVFVDAYATRLEDFIGSLFSSYGVNLTYLGGGAGSLEEEGQPCILTNEGVIKDGAVFVTVNTPTSLGVKHGWETIAGPIQVTDADGPNLSELNAESAYSVYKEIVEEDANVDLEEEDFFEVAKSYPFGISRLDGEMIVRDPFEVTDDGGLTCFGNLHEDEFLHVLKGDDQSLIDAVGEAYEEVAPESNGTSEVLFFDCISRVLYLEDAFDRELDAVGNEGDNPLGALTIGEIANNGKGHLDYFNKTAVVAITEQL